MLARSRVTHSRGLLLVVALFLAACSGTPAVATPTPTLPPGGGTPQPTQPGGGTPQPTIGPGQPTPPGGGGGGGVFPEGAWQAGAAHVVITGDYNTTVDLQLIPFASMSTVDITIFQYGSDTNQVFLSVSLDAASVNVVITTPEFVGGGGTTTDSACGVTFGRQETNAVAGAITCQSAVVISTGGIADKHISLQAQFTATR